MKIRSCFVSNSSSSSFVVCYKANDENNLDEFVKNYVLNFDPNDYFEEDMIEFDGYSMPMNRKKFYEKYKDPVTNGHKLKVFEINSEDSFEEIISTIFEELKKSKFLGSDFTYKIDYDY